MRLEITPQTMKDIERIKQKLIRAAQDIKDDTQNKVQEVGHLGFNFAYNLAPEYTGALKQAMRLDFPDMNSFMIVSSHPKGDIPATHIAFDTGIFTGMAIKIGKNEFKPFEPRIASSVGYMKQTAFFLQKEFADRLKMTIHYNIKKIGVRR